MTYETVEGTDTSIKAWTVGVPFDQSAKVQLRYTAMLPVVGPHIAVMPDVHAGIGSTVGSVIPTRKAVIPASVGVDIGCGMMAVRTSLTSHDVSDNAQELFETVSEAVPHGGTKNKETGNWETIPKEVAETWSLMAPKYNEIIGKNSRASSKNAAKQLGTLGGGNHFVEVCLDEADRVWFMLHSGSRGAGNRIGEFFIELAQREMERLGVKLPPDRNLAYLQEGTQHFDDYAEALQWAQSYAMANRELMMGAVVRAVRAKTKKFDLTDEAVNCHHNYVQKEKHFGETLWITRKGAVSARRGELGIIPGSMGARSYIVRGLGNAESFHSCSHGAGRVMSRGQAKKEITLEMHREATKGVACRKDRDVIDESPAAYKDIDAVMNAQKDLVEVVHQLRQIACVKG